MRRIKILLLSIFNLVSLMGVSQLNLNTSMTPGQMVKNVLLGNGVTATNFIYSGGANSMAAFTNGNTTNIGLNNGLILCTGYVSQINNPASVLMSNDLDLAGDADLDNINNGRQTYDASVLQFDFVPLSDTVKFRYVFGSEEYPQSVCDKYNDIFAFFISGPNPDGGSDYDNYNIALIPGTVLPVSVNSVNSGIPGGSHSSTDCISLAYSNYYVDNTTQSGQTIVFGGFTVPLTAVCHVVQCVTYKIKIAVADGANELYDSGVFLEANSFSTNTYSVSTSYSNSSLGDTAVEGCSNGIFSFKLGSPTTAPYEINYTVGGTATAGSDYYSLPGTITIPAGQDSAAIIINPLSDDEFQENTETVIIYYNNGCFTQSDTIFIRNKNPLSLSISNDTTICEGASAHIKTYPVGGIQPYTYLWSISETNDHITVSPSWNTWYAITVSDACSQTATKSITISVNSFSADITSTNEFCGQGNGTASVITKGICNSYYSYSWSESPISSQAIGNLSEGTYTVTVTCGKCSETATTTIQNIDATASIFANPETTTLMDGPITFAGVSNGNISDWQWDFGDGQFATGQYTTHQYDSLGEHTITLVTTDNNGCINTTHKSVKIIEIFTLYIPNAFSPDGDGLNDIFIPQGLSIDIDNYEMLIFNRWGNLVFQTTNFSEGWNGSGFNAGSYKDAIPGVYVYKIRLFEEMGKEHEYYGKIILMK